MKDKKLLQDLKIHKEIKSKHPINYRTKYFSTSTLTKAMRIPFLHNIKNKVFVNTFVDTRLIDFEQDKTDYLKTIQDLDQSKEHQTEINSMETSNIIKAIPAEGQNTFQLYKELINQARKTKKKLF